MTPIPKCAMPSKHSCLLGIIIVSSFIQFLHLRDDAQLRIAHKLDNVTYLGTVGHLLLNLNHSIEEGGLTVEHQTIGVGHMLHHLVVDAIELTHGGVDAAKLHALGTDDARWHVLREGGTGLHHRSTTYANTSISNDAGREDGTILNLAVTGNLGAVAEDTAVAHLGVMRDMGTFHQHVLVADNGLSTGMGGTVDDHILADDVAIADDALRLLATELKILRQSTYHGTLVHLIILAHARATEDADEGEDDTVVTNLYIVLDIHEGIYLTVVANLRLGRYLSSWTNFACHMNLPQPLPRRGVPDGFQGDNQASYVVNTLLHFPQALLPFGEVGRGHLLPPPKA